MTDTIQPTPRARRALPAVQLKVWHLSLLVVFVAIAIKNIQDQRRSEPTLIALAAVGFALYGVLGWHGWRIARRFEGRIGTSHLLAFYLVGMAGLFLLSTVIYLVIEHIYLVGLV